MATAPVFLLVEPSPFLRFTMRQWLDDVLTDHRILIAGTGDGALQIAAQEQPTHILIEMSLPDISGFDVLQQLRQSLPTAQIIATHWYESRLFHERTRSAGANEFIPKHELHLELLSRLK